MNVGLSRCGFVVLLCGAVLASFCVGCKSKSKSPTTAPAEAVKPGPQRWAVLIHHARGYRSVLADHYDWPADHIIEVDNPTPKKLTDAFGRVPKLSRDDLFLFAVCHHAGRGYVFNNQWPWRQVEQQLARIGATNAVLLETCHGGLAMEHLPSADVVYSACDALNKCGGIFQRLLIAALTNAASDTDGDGNISLAEAYDVAADPAALREQYSQLHKNSPNFWPTSQPAIPVRSPGRRGYKISLGRNWDLSKSGAEQKK
ncbi:MAG: hypothetical protein SVT52_07545 [Planctomycetota bacterium]|nr:hypothetical protein [Planctomycetota bacterium]